MEDQKIKRQFDLLQEYIEPSARQRWRLDYQATVEVARRLRAVGRLLGLRSAAFEITQDTNLWHIQPANEAAKTVLTEYEAYILNRELSKG